jgi:uncharacterized protein YjdB
MKKITVLFILMFAAFFMKAQTTSPAPYCDAEFDDAIQIGFPLNVPDAIFSVSFGTLNNNTGSQAAFPYYTFYNNLPIPDFTIGNSYTASTELDVYGGAGYGIWIDYNHNNVFDANEKVGGSANILDWLPLGTNIKTDNITIPTTALPGNTRMRIRVVEDDGYTMAFGPLILPCNVSPLPNDVMDWGETEDYTINLVQNFPVTSIAVTGQGGASTITTNGGTLQMLANVLPANATNNTVTWSVTPGTGNATISTTGLLTATANGTVTVTATANDGSGVIGTMTVTISNQIVIVLVTSINVQGQGGVNNINVNGGTLQMVANITPTTATNQSVTWSVAPGTGNATISATGLLTAVSNGTVIVTATANDGSGIFDNKTIFLSNQTPLVNSIMVQGQGGVSTITVNGATLQMLATVLPTYAFNSTYSWSVINGTGSATIDAAGLLTPITNGTVTVKATANDASGVFGTATITISNQVINLVTSIVVQGQGGLSSINTNAGTLQMIATVLPTNATNSTVSWSVQNGTGSATINATTGLLTAISNGMVTVKATANDGTNIFGTKVITITNQSTNLPVTMITVNSNSNSINEGSTLQMFATVLPNAATNNTVTWSVTNGTGTANINAAGLLTGITAGTVEVKATANDGSGIFGVKTITITKPNAISSVEDAVIAVYPNPSNGTMFVKSSNEFTSFEIYSLLGEKIISSSLLTSNTIDIRHLTNGNYLLVLTSKSNERFMKRISKN